MPSYQWVWKGKADPYTVQGLNPVSPVPDEEVRDALLTNVNQALGEFVLALLNEGHVCTTSSYSFQVETKTLRRWFTGGIITHYYGEFQVHGTFTLDFESDSDFMASPLLPALVVAIGKAIFWILLGIGGLYFIANYGTESSTVTKYDWVENPDTGEMEYVPVSTETSSSGANWMDVAPLLIIFLLFMGMGSRKND